MSRVKTIGVLGVILAMSLVFASGASAAKEAPVLRFALEEPTGSVPVAVGDDVQVRATSPVKFDTGSWSVECSSATMSGTVGALSSEEMKLSLTTAAFSGIGGGACTSTAGNADIAIEELPWANVLAKKGKAELEPESGAKYLTFTVGLSVPGEEEVKCSYRADKVTSVFSKTGEPITLTAAETKFTVAKLASSPECPKTGYLQSSSWSLTSGVPKGESFPVVLKEPQAESVPAPPSEVGCFSYEEGAWHQIECVEEPNLPHPEITDGVKQGTKRGPIKMGTLNVETGHFGEIGPKWGSERDSIEMVEDYSLQLNTNEFPGVNGHKYLVQWVDQIYETEPAFYPGPANAVCIWQVNVTVAEETENKQGYQKKCIEQFTSQRFGLFGERPGMGIQGWTATGPKGSVIGIIWTGLVNGHTKWLSKVETDLYGLGQEDRWSEDGGSVYGYGGGSEAEFSDSQIEIEVGASSCKSHNPTGWDTVFSESCTTEEALQPHASTVGNRLTGESNNLIPVIGSPPSHLPHLYYNSKYSGSISYVATPTGACLLPNERPPRCNFELQR